MIKPYAPGAPFALLAMPPEVIVTEVGEFEAEDGARIVIVGNEIVFKARTEGTDIAIGIGIDQLLDAISEYTRTHES